MVSGSRGGSTKCLVGALDPTEIILNFFFILR